MDTRRMTVKEISRLLLLERHKILDNPLLEELKRDKRRGVQMVLERILAKEKKEKAERKRLHNMLSYELSKREEGYHKIAGIDEAGRGPLAGPVVAAAVILSPGQEYIWGLNDSKKLTFRQRQIIYEKVCERSLAMGIGVVDVPEIDSINIHNAALLAMRRAIYSMKEIPDYLLVDGFEIPGVPFPQEAVLKGDSKILSIAASSVVAKVVRDRIMAELHCLYPQYGFCHNKGYPTKQHRAALKVHGPSPVHRRSFKL